jgi:hypothetical protein
MSRLRVALLGVIALGAINAVAAQSASAACPVAGGHIRLCFKLTQAAAGKYKFTTVQTGETLIEAAALEVHAVCTESPGEGEFDQPPLAGVENLKVEKTVFKFKGCTLLEPLAAACEINPGTAGQITTKALLASIDEEIKAMSFVAEAGTEIASVVIKSKPGKTCSKPGALALTGEQDIKLLAPSIDGTTEPLEAVEAGGKLKLGTANATFKTNANLKLENGEEFTIELG